MILSVCGQECDQCNFFPEDCAGCPEMGGKPFWTKGLPEKECVIFSCVKKRKMDHCGECGELPCDKYQSTKDPAMNEEAHRKGILDRVNRLKKDNRSPESVLMEEMDTDYPEKAVRIFNSGMNCSQAILSAYAGKIGLETGTALRIAGGFGAGMARMQETCGAVSGAVMVIGMKMINKNTGPDDLRGKVYDTIQEFFKQFRKLNKTTECAELIKCDLRTEKGRKTFHEKKLNETVCGKCVRDAAEILENLINF